MATGTNKRIYYPVEETSLTYNGVTFYFRRYADFVVILYRDGSQKTFSTSWVNIGTLPNWYRPRADVYAQGGTTTSVNLVFRLLSNGNVDILATANTATYLQGSAIFPVR